MSIQQTEKSASVLVSGKLNVVGETHTESDPRRKDEKRFALAMTGGGYWTEAELLDQQQPVGARRQRVRQGPASDDQPADLMEMRAAHAAGLLLDEFEKLAAEASTVANTPTAMPWQAITALVKKALDFKNVEGRIDRGWRQTVTPAVDLAVQAMFDNVSAARNKYRDDLKAAQANKSVDEAFAATRAFASNAVALRNLSEAVMKAVGAPPSTDPDALKNYARKQRSMSMGLAAVLSGQLGVWKVGRAHIADLQSGVAKVDTSRINLVTKEAFNQEFETWLLANPDI